MTHFIREGSSFNVTDSANMDIRPTLPAGTYTVMLHPMRGFYLEQVEDMRVPKKVYGSVPQRAERILSTFTQRESNTGVLLSGDKGGGKTMLLRTLSAALRAANIPTIIIAAPYRGEAFNKFMQSISQPCMIAIDEFEKLYGDERNQGAEVNSAGNETQGPASQNSLLSLLDGMYNGKKLFVLTANSANRVSPFMFNRPGRLFYHLKYSGMEEKVIEQYCGDYLKNKDHFKSLLQLVAQVDNFNFDLLQAVVEEMNRYNESALEAATMLNIRPESSPWVSYEYKAYVDNKVQKCWGPVTSSNPLSTKSYMYIKTDKKMGNDSDPDAEDILVTFYPNFENMKQRDVNMWVFEEQVDGHYVRVEVIRKGVATSSAFDAY